MSETTEQVELLESPGHTETVRELREDIRFWHGTDERALLELNKSLITLSTGGIGVSILFIVNKYAPHNWWDTFVLSVSWIAFTLAIFCILLSYNAARRTAGFRVQLAEFLSKEYETGELIDIIEKSGNRTGYWTRVGQWLFVAGVILTMVFILIEI